MITWAIPAEQKQTKQLARWTADIIWPGKNKSFGNCRGLAVIDGQKLIAAVIYHNWEPEAGIVELSAASLSKRWITRETLRIMFQIPFVDWKCQAVVMRVADDNTQMHRIAKAYGFQHYIIPRLRGRTENENVFVLTDDAWRNNKFYRKNEVH